MSTCECLSCSLFSWQMLNDEKYPRNRSTNNSIKKNPIINNHFNVVVNSLFSFVLLWYDFRWVSAQAQTHCCRHLVRYETPFDLFNLYFLCFLFHCSTIYILMNFPHVPYFFIIFFQVLHTLKTHKPYSMYYVKLNLICVKGKERKRKSKAQDIQKNRKKKMLIWKFRMVAAVLAAITPSIFPLKSSLIQYNISVEMIPLQNKKEN